MAKITVLHNELDEFENEDSGFSLLIDIDNLKILFDVSFSDDILKNAEKSKINLDIINYLVLSHGHIDHTDGLRFIDFSTIKIVLAHPDCFQKKYFGEKIETGCPVDLAEIKRRTNIILSKEPYWIKKDEIVFLGEIPRANNFEAKEPIGYLEDGKGDFVSDDSALVIKSDEGLIIISGCSHSGICNIIEHAKEVCNQDKIKAVIGGFHLFDKNITDKTIDYFKTRNINKIHPAHCLDKYAFSEFEKIGARRLRTLMELSFKT